MRKENFFTALRYITMVQNGEIPLNFGLPSSVSIFTIPLIFFRQTGILFQCAVPRSQVYRSPIASNSSPCSASPPSPSLRNDS
jgi:hypothetical protein